MTDCPEHPGQTYTRCGLCRSEALASGDPRDLAAWHARQTITECDTRLPSRYRNATVEHPDVLAWLDDWHRNPRECGSLMLSGTVGVGKTWEAFGALRAAVTGPQATTWEAVVAPEMHAALRPSPKGDPEAVMRRYQTVGLLLVDDLGTGKSSEWVEESMYRVIGSRYNDCLPTIYTTNVTNDRLRETLGDRVASRLNEICDWVVMTGPDRRRQVRAA